MTDSCEATGTGACDDLPEQIAELTGELSVAELADLQITRQTLVKLAHRQVTAGDPRVASEPYQRILAVFDTDECVMRAKDVCHAFGIGVAPKGTEGIRAKLKRLVDRQILTETEPGHSPSPTNGRNFPNHLYGMCRAGARACGTRWA
jgi:hypothetical protein